MQWVASEGDICLAMRNKHRCHLCSEVFSRRWNMERHIEKKHHSNLKSLFVPFRHMKDEVSKFGSLNPNYNRSTSDIYNSSEIWSALPYLQDKSAYEQNEDPFDAWLKMLRKMVEFRKRRAIIRTNISVLLCTNTSVLL